MPCLQGEISEQVRSAAAVTVFFRYPQTPHIAWLADGQPRDDKVLSLAEATEFLVGKIMVEEKLDGANLGFSVGRDGALRIQNRGQYLAPPFVGQFTRLGDWLSAHQDSLLNLLPESLVIFGEWCAARHSLDYDRLPDWWMVFDVYDRKAQRFLSTARRDQLASALGLASVPCLHHARVDLSQLKEWVSSDTSRFRNGNLEGLVLRREDPQWLIGRAKLVRPGFTQSITEHWRKRMITWNRVAYPTGSPLLTNCQVTVQ